VSGQEALISHKTSGSTGTPVCIFRSPVEERRLNMFRWRMYLENGLRPGDRMAKVKTVWEALPDRFERLSSLASKLKVVDRRLFDCLEPPAELLNQLREFQPHLLTGYPSALVKIALQHEDPGKSLGNLRQLLTGGEYLAPHQRRLLEQRFGVPVTDTYGASEFNLGAWQCTESGHYHVCDDSVLLEVCRDGLPVEPGEEGDVLVTVLHSRHMPLIRYDMGDRAIAGGAPCSCGKPFTTIKSFEGRIMDYLVHPDGTHFHPLHLANELILEAFDWMAEYQLVQESAWLFRLQIVPLREVTAGELESLHRVLQRKLAEGVELKIENVEDIPAGNNGKYRFCRTVD
jgi:phenylacetate-CoA ligase